MATKTKTINRTISDATDTRCQIQDTSYKILALKTRVTQSKAKPKVESVWRLAWNLSPRLKCQSRPSDNLPANWQTYKLLHGQAGRPTGRPCILYLLDTPATAVTSLLLQPRASRTFVMHSVFLLWQQQQRLPQMYLQQVANVRVAADVATLAARLSRGERTRLQSASRLCCVQSQSQTDTKIHLLTNLTSRYFCVARI